MDSVGYIFPLIMAILTNSVMIVAVYFLRKSKYFANLFGIGFMTVLYLFCAVRIFLPIEFPDIQIILRDTIVYTKVFDFFNNNADWNYDRFQIVMLSLAAVWLIGTVVFALATFISQRRYKRYIDANFDFATEHERELLSDIAKDVLKSDRNIALKKTDAVSGAMVIGFFKKTVLLPEKDYSDEELEMIFRHECTHIRNKDLWIKLLVQIYICIFWWNPFSYLLKADLGFNLEMKCDLSVTKDFSDEEKVRYVETVRDNRSGAGERKVPFLVSSELADSKKSREFVKRIKAVLANPPKKARQVVLNIFVAVCFLLLFAGSYLFIWQPFYGLNAPIQDYDVADNGLISDENNAYLVKQEDGNYILYFLGIEAEKISKEEVEQGLYNGYPIYEE